MIFHESGSFPGVPGSFSGVQVTLDEEGQPVAQPLAQHPFFEPAPPEAEIVSKEEPSAPTKKRAQAKQQAGEAETPVPGEEAS